jgi:ribonucleoside-diphosphate reductase alpha chain
VVAARDGHRVSKYFRRAGLFGDPSKGETSVRQVVHRIAHTIREAGELRGYFADADEADTFEAELSWTCSVHQYGAFNSPVWFNCGLFQRYGIEGSGRQLGLGRVHGGAVAETTNAYERPQCSACFIQSVQDDLMGIFDLVKNEARLFKYGSGTGSNFSALRGRQEKLSGGGTSSGLMSFLEVFDRAAGRTKSGGTTRRAAKMVCLDMDHPEIVDFIEWKMREEKKAQALIAAGYPSDFNGEAYHTVSGRTPTTPSASPTSSCAPWRPTATWQTAPAPRARWSTPTGAKDLWRKVAESAWACADPGVQYDTTINDWHTCPAAGASTRATRARSTCSSTTRPATCRRSTSRSSSATTPRLELRRRGLPPRGARVFFLAQEILVDFARTRRSRSRRTPTTTARWAWATPTSARCSCSWASPTTPTRGARLAGALTAILTGQAYRVSAEMAAHKGPFAATPRTASPCSA